jgi:ABC-2 type transport system permease protein
MMLRKAAAIAAKEFRHLRNDRLSLGLVLGLPAFQLLLYGYALDTKIRNLPAAIVNHDTHQAGRVLTQRLSSSPLFTITERYRSEPEIEEAMRSGKIRFAIEIPQTYTTDLLSGRPASVRVWVDGLDVVSSNYGVAALEAVAAQDPADLPSFHPRIAIETKFLFNPSGDTANFLIPGLIPILIQIVTTLLIALSITNERERGTLEHMLVLGVRSRDIVLGKCIAVASISVLQASLLIAIMRLQFGIPIHGSFILLLECLPLYVLAPIGIGLIIAAASRTHTHALQLTHLVSLPSLLLSGFFIPREFLKFPMGLIGNILPSTYLIALARNVIVRGADLQETRFELLCALLIGSVLSLAGAVAIHRSIQSERDGS